jgi:hypothetical protein
MVCTAHFQKPEVFSYGLGQPPLVGTSPGLIWARYGYEMSEISPQGEQLGTDEAKVVCLPLVLEIDDSVPHFHTP